MNYRIDMTSHPIRVSWTTTTGFEFSGQLKEILEDALIVQLADGTIRGVEYNTMNTTKYVEDHPEWNSLAKRRDDLKHVWLFYGCQFSDSGLRALQEDVAKAENELTQLETRLLAEGYLR